MLARLMVRFLRYEKMRGKGKTLLLVGVLALASVLAALEPTPTAAVTAGLTIRPSSSGSFTEWTTYPAGTSNWEYVDEIIQNGDVDYVYVNASGMVDSYGFQDIAQTGLILNVRVCVYARQTVGDEKLRHILVIDGVKYNGSVEYTPANTTYLLYVNDWPNNPATNSSWTWSDINSLEAGVESVGVGGWDGEIRVTQIFIEVTVTDLKMPTVSVSPTSVVGPPPNIDETFSINITVTNVVDLYSWQVGMTFNATVVEALSLVEGPFLKQGGTTIMANGTIDNIAGIIYRHSCSLTGPVPGVSGNGTIATITFRVKSFGNSTLHLTDVILLDSSLTEIPVNMTDGFFEIKTPILDVYTQKAGQGPIEPGDAFSPGERVELTAHLTYGGENLSGVNVGFQVDDPTGAVFVILSDETDVNGLATVSFRLPLNSTFGTYNVTASAAYIDYTAIDMVTFEVGWIVELISITPSDVNGIAQNSFVRGGMVFFKVIVKNIALEPQIALITVNSFDMVNVSIGVTSMKGSIAPGTSESIIGATIPNWAWPGPAMVYANAFTDWPILGGVAYCPQVSATFEITL